MIHFLSGRGDGEATNAVYEGDEGPRSRAPAALSVALSAAEPASFCGTCAAAAQCRRCEGAQGKAGGGAAVWSTGLHGWC